MDQELAQKIITEISRFSAKKYGLTDSIGNLLAKTNDFSLSHNPLEIKSKRCFPILFDNQRIGFLFIDENLKTVKEIGPIVKSMVELIVHQNYFSEFLTQDEKRIDQLIFEYFKLENTNRREIKKMLSVLGIEIENSKIAIILEISDNKFLFGESESGGPSEREQKIARIKRDIKFILNSFYTHHRQNIVSYLGGKMFLILKDMGENASEYEKEFKKTLNSLFLNIKEALRTNITMGIGQYKKGPLGLIESFHEAETALKFGKQNWGDNKLFHFDSFGVVAPLFSGANKENVTVSRNIIKNLNKYPDLIKSLEVYFDSDISLSKTARRLKIHRNTLIYRLEKIADVSNLDPRIFNDAFQLYIALLLNKYSNKND